MFDCYQEVPGDDVACAFLGVEILANEPSDS